MRLRHSLFDYFTGAALDSAHPVNLAVEAVKATPPAAVLTLTFFGYPVADWFQLLMTFYAFCLSVQMCGRFYRYVVDRIATQRARKSRKARRARAMVQTSFTDHVYV